MTIPLTEFRFQRQIKFPTGQSGNF